MQKYLFVGGGLYKSDKNFITVGFDVCWTIVDVSFDKSLSSIGLGTEVMNVVFPCDMLRNLLYQVVEYSIILLLLYSDQH